MIEVYWFEQADTDVPLENDWLSSEEIRRLNGLHFAKRRADWRLGRWTGKCAVAHCLNLYDDFTAFAKIEIRASDTGAPEAFLSGRDAGVSISLSHSSSQAACAVTHSQVTLGCDLEKVEPRSRSFVRDYFTADEQHLIASSTFSERGRMATLLWSAKESALKVLRTGLRLDTRCVVVSLSDVSFGPGQWHPLEVRCLSGDHFYGWWQHREGFLRTMVSSIQADPPVCREIPSFHERALPRA
jgi:4'-phosphopantetheinyl transferase